jgi:hypothetical protein
MAKTSTTLAGAIGPSDWLIGVANKAALNPGDNIVVGTETMKTLIVGAAGAPAVVYRGARGTNGQAAAGGAVLSYGPPTDWGVSVGVSSVLPEGVAAELAAEDAKELEERIEKAEKKVAAASKSADTKPSAPSHR